MDQTDLQNKLNQIINRYERLGLKNSPYYLTIKNWASNTKFLDQTVNNISKIKNGEKIFDIVSQITQNEADSRMVTMLAEYDTAIRLTDWANGFFGAYTEAEYLPKTTKRNPDFKVMQGNKIIAVETKSFSNTDKIDFAKFYNKLIKKVKHDALPQLRSFHKDTPVDYGIIFVWSQKHLELTIDRAKAYDQIRKEIKKDIPSTNSSFNVKLIIMFSNPLDLWDFYICSSASPTSN